MVEPSSSFEEDQIDMFELIRKLLRAWKTILISIIICAGLAFIYAWNAPEVYKAETLLVPTQEEKSTVPSALTQFGGLAAMAGITIPSNSNVERVLATLETREFLKSFIIKKELLPIIYNRIVRTNDPTKVNTPVIFDVLKSKPYPRSQAKCLNSFKI